MRNTFTNVKLYPTTILNNKIIYNQVEKLIQIKIIAITKILKINKSENSNNNRKIYYNTSKIKKEKIVIDTTEKRPNKNIKQNENFQSMKNYIIFMWILCKKVKNKLFN